MAGPSLALMPVVIASANIASYSWIEIAAMNHLDSSMPRTVKRQHEWRGRSTSFAGFAKTNFHSTT
jgi:hypothetical protein